MNPVMQDAAANALARRPCRFDGGRGWRDLEKSVDLDGDWAGELDRAPVGTGFPDWKKAVVLSKDRHQATIGFTNGSTGTLPRSVAEMPKRGGGGTAFSNLRPGMIIIVKQLGASSYALRSIPEIGGGFLAEEVRTGPCARHAGRVRRGRVRFTIAPLKRCASLARRSSRSSTRPRLENGMSPASIIMDAPFCASQGRGFAAEMLPQLRQQLRLVRRRCAGASSNRAT